MNDNAFDFYQRKKVSPPSALFYTFTDTFYFAKNRQGCFVYANQLLYEHFKLDAPRDVIGKTNHDFYGEI